MADIVWQDVIALQANLSTVSPAAQMIFLAYVNRELNPRIFGGEDSAQFHLARCFMAAHMGELERRKGERAVASETFGTSSISIAYATTDDALQQTSWGGQYATLLASSPYRIGAGLCR